MQEQDSFSPESPPETQIIASPAPPPQLVTAPAPSSASAHEIEASKESTPMIDIHPAHHAATTWREFLIHISTIVLGLFIAIGLEQAVVAINHARERRELIADMRDEAARNVVILHRDIDIQIEDEAWQAVFMHALQQATPRAGVVTFTPPPYRAPLAGIVNGDRAVWSIAQANGKAALLNEQQSEIYSRLEYEAGQVADANRQAVSASADLNAEMSLTLPRIPKPAAALKHPAAFTVSVAELPSLLRAMALDGNALGALMEREAHWAGAAEASPSGNNKH